MLWYIVFGAATGMRAMTPIAVLCWCAWMGLMHLTGWASWASYLVSASVFTALALGEYVGDTLPKTPSRKAPLPAVSRIVFGALCGALLANATVEPLAGGILFGAIGAVLGTWGGYWARTRTARLVGRDLPVALTESALALAIAVYAFHRIYLGIVIDAKRGIP